MKAFTKPDSVLPFFHAITEIDCEVIFGGELKNNKGINLPGVNVSCPSLTEKDRADALFALELGVDYLALSFVRRAEDIDGLRQLITDNGYETHIIAKLEKPEAL
jgi:pyruvate kinase